MARQRVRSSRYGRAAKCETRNPTSHRSPSDDSTCSVWLCPAAASTDKCRSPRYAAAVGAQLALPDRRVIGVIGDGSANYGITALWTAARYGVPVVVIILKNGTYGALRWFSELLGTSEVSVFDLQGIDFVRIAEGYGVHATAVSSADDFALALKAALVRTTPTLIEVTTADLGAA
jgi:TPP-dependent trihydroxycyclohexane-1,2-dione (THcHDO) dehydratase